MLCDFRGSSLPDKLLFGWSAGAQAVSSVLFSQMLEVPSVSLETLSPVSRRMCTMGRVRLEEEEKVGWSASKTSICKVLLQPCFNPDTSSYIPVQHLYVQVHGCSVQYRQMINLKPLAWDWERGESGVPGGEFRAPSIAHTR